MIVHEVNIFQQRSEQKHSFSHRCNLYHTRNGGCPATLTTDKEQSLLLSLKGPHNHPDRSPNTLEKQRKRHRLHTTYTANLHKPLHSWQQSLECLSTTHSVYNILGLENVTGNKHQKPECLQQQKES